MSAERDEADGRIAYVELDSVELLNKALSVSRARHDTRNILMVSFRVQSSWVSLSASSRPSLNETEKVKWKLLLPSTSILHSCRIMLISDFNRVNGNERKDKKKELDHRETTYQSSHH